MTETAVAYCDLSDSKAAGTALGSRIKTDLGGRSPDAVIVFASSKHNYTELLEALKAACSPEHIVGCSSAGEFVAGKAGEGAASALAIRSSQMRFQSGLGRGLRRDREAAARELASSFEHKSATGFAYRSALLLADALAGHTDDLIERLTVLTAGACQFFGGGAGDDARFSSTHVFFGTEAITDAVVGLEILSNAPIGIGVRHGWQPAGAPMRVTEADGMRLMSLNSIPAAEVFEEYAVATGQKFDRAEPIPFFLHNTLGIEGASGHKLRVPLTVSPDGSVLCASDIPTGATVRFMKATAASSVEAARNAVQSALQQIEGRRPKAALFFDCVATRLRMGGEFGLELASLAELLGESTAYAGCNTYGQIARVDGQFSGFHNCTAVVCVFPE